MDLRAIVRRRPLLAYVLGAFGLSWACWAVPLLAPDGGAAGLLYRAGGFGPWVSALAVVALTGGRPGAWLRGLFAWRTGARWWAFALLWPPTLAMAGAGLHAAAGGAWDPAVPARNLAAWPAAFAMLAVAGGGNEEPGWRGFALPRMLARWSPVGATWRLGLIWALWHLPLLGFNPEIASGRSGAAMSALIVGALVLSVTLHAFWYTWLLARTGSVLLCLVLHAGCNAANGLLVPVPAAALTGDAGVALLLAMTAALGLSVAALCWATRGRLGVPAPAGGGGAPPPR